MATPRSTQIDLGATPYYHCISRCVRRAYLCGYDKESKRSLDHRKQWLIDKIKHLSSIFYIQIAAYAIMDNHYHLVLHVNTSQAYQSTEEDILSRWKALFPKNAKAYQSNLVSAESLKNKIEQWRKRFMNISCFMQLLNEYIARLANKEDDCNGRFWQGRYKSQALLDEAAVLGAMVYVDLNPIRAGIADTPETSQFTSIYERIKAFAPQLIENPAPISSKNDRVNIDELKQPRDIMSFGNNNNPLLPQIEFNLSEYIQLVETTGKLIRDDKKGHISVEILPIIERIKLQISGWISLVTDLENDFYYAVGSSELLSAFGRAERCRNIKGFSKLEKCYKNVA